MSKQNSLITSTISLEFETQECPVSLFFLTPEAVVRISVRKEIGGGGGLGLVGIVYKYHKPLFLSINPGIFVKANYSALKI